MCCVPLMTATEDTAGTLGRGACCVSVAFVLLDASNVLQIGCSEGLL